MFAFIHSAIDNIKERVKNPFYESNKTPFAGAFVISLVIYNWELFYSLVNFDPHYTRLTKIDIIKDYLETKAWYDRLFTPILFAFGSIVSFYILNLLSLGLNTLYNRWGKASVFYFFDVGKNVPKLKLDNAF